MELASLISFFRTLERGNEHNASKNFPANDKPGVTASQFLALLVFHSSPCNEDTVKEATVEETWFAQSLHCNTSVLNSELSEVGGTGSFLLTAYHHSRHKEVTLSRRSLLRKHGSPID